MLGFALSLDQSGRKTVKDRDRKRDEASEQGEKESKKEEERRKEKKRTGGKREGCIKDAEGAGRQA